MAVKKRILWIILAVMSLLFIMIGGIFMFLSTDGLAAKRKPYNVKEPSSRDFFEVFKTPKSITVESFHTAILTSKRSGVYNLQSSNAVGMKDGAIDLAVKCYLIRHPLYGNYLIDTGLDAMTAETPYGNLKGFLVESLVGKAKQDKGHDIASILKSRNIKLDGVFFTHLHFDHIAGAIDLPANIPYVAGRGEVYQNYPLLFYGDYLNHIDTLFEIDFSQGIEMNPFLKCVDIFGDGSLWAIWTPGHTQGHTSFLVNSAGGSVLITGDANLTQEALDKNIPTGKYSADLKTAEESFYRIKEFKHLFPFVRLNFSHE